MGAFGIVVDASEEVSVTRGVRAAVDWLSGLDAGVRSADILGASGLVNEIDVDN